MSISCVLVVYNSYDINADIYLGGVDLFSFLSGKIKGAQLKIRPQND